MPIVIVCQKCGQRYSVQDRAAGHTVQCQKCQASIAVPDPNAAADPVPLDPVPLEPVGGDPQPNHSAGLPAMGSGDPFSVPAPASPFAQPPKSSAGGNPLAKIPMLWVGVGGGGLVLVVLLLIMFSFIFSGDDDPEPAPTTVADTSNSSPAVVPAVAPVPTVQPTPTAPQSTNAPATANPSATKEPSQPLLPSRPSQPLLPSGKAPPVASTKPEPAGFGTGPAQWSVEADPLPEPIDWPGRIKVTLPSRVKIYWPATPSPYVAVYHDDFRKGGCAVFDLSKNRKLPGGIAGRIRDIGPWAVCALSPDGKHLAVPSRRNNVVVYDMTSGEVASELSTAAEHVAFASPGVLLLLGSSLWIHDLKQGKNLHEILVSSGENLAVSPGGRYVAVSANDRVSVYEIKTGEEVGQVKMKIDSPFGASDLKLAFSPDGTALAAVGGRRGVHIAIWNVATGQQELNTPLESEATGDIWSLDTTVDWLSDNTALLVKGHIVVDRKTGGVLHVFPKEDGSEFPRRPISDGRIVGVVTMGAFKPKQFDTAKLPADKLAKAREMLKAGATSQDLNLPPLTVIDLAGVKEIVPEDRGWTYQPDGAPVETADQMATVSLEEIDPSEIRFAGYGVPTAALLRSDKHRHPSPFRKEGSVVAQLNLSTGRITRQVKLPPQPYRLMDVSADGNLALTGLTKGNWDETSRLDVYSVAAQSGHVVAWRPFQDEKPDGWSLDGSPDVIGWAGFTAGNQVATLNESQKLIVWSVPDCKAIYQIPKLGDVVGMSPGRKYLLVIVDRALKLLDLTTGQYAGKLPLSNMHPRFMASAFSPRGDRLAVVSPRGFTLVNLQDGTVAAEFAMAATAFRSIQWCSDRHLIADQKYLVDLDKKTVVWKYQVPAFGSDSIHGTPDLRLWFLERDKLVGVPVPSREVLRNAELADIKKQAIVSPGSTIAISSVSVGVGDVTEDEARDALTRAFTKHGVNVVANAPITVSLDTEQKSTGRKLVAKKVFGGRGEQEVFEQQQIIITLEVNGPGDKSWRGTYRAGMRSSGTAGENAQQQLSDEMHRSAARRIREISVPEYIFPNDIWLNSSRLSSTGESFLPSKR